MEDEKEFFFATKDAKSAKKDEYAFRIMTTIQVKQI